MQIEMAVGSVAVIFFPSCASVALARSSHIVVLMNEFFRCIFYVPPSRKWSADHYAVRSLAKHIRQEKQKQSTTTKTKPKTKPSERSTDKTAPMGLATYVPMNYKILHGNRQPTPDHTARSCEDVSKTIHSAAPKPRIPPARIPEIALRSPMGMRHLRNERQLCNELERNTSVGTLPCEAPRQIYW